MHLGFPNKMLMSFIFQDLFNGNAITVVIADSESLLFAFACLRLINLNSMLEGNIDYAYSTRT